MTQMTDPTDAILSFQKAMSTGELRLESGRLDPKVYLHADIANGKPRFTYAFLEGKTVTALATFANNGSYQGHGNIAVGYAVPEAYRNKGLAKAILRAGIAEMQNGFNGMPAFYVEAVVSEQNTASLKVAEAVLGKELERFKDGHSGEPAVRFARKFETGRSHNQ
jgi:RimJ/RimL family protein N-acetyltransferase